MEKIKVTFLGTSGSVPKKDSNFASCVISFNGENILFDAPEGIQRQLMISNLSLMKINNCFISHLHADHFLGLFGWIATMNLNQRKEKLTIYSPKGGKEKINRMLKEVLTKTSFLIEHKEIKTGLVLKNNFFTISSFKLDHEIPCFGFCFKENDLEGRFDRKKAEKLKIPAGPLYSKLVSGKTITVNGKKFNKKDVFDFTKKRTGRKIVIAMDSRPTKTILKSAEKADLLIHESTFLENKKDRAIETKHSTAKEAALIAKKSKVKQLILTHLSASINDTMEVEKEAKEIFSNTKVVKDFEEIFI